LLIRKHGGGLRLLPGSSRAAVAAWETGPDDLAAELNPHKTELNPHEAVPGRLAAPEQITSGAFSADGA